MKLTLEEIKNSLRIDFDDDDRYLELINAASTEQLKSMTGFDLEKSDSSRAKIVCLAIIHELYKDRSLTTEKAGEQIKPVMRDILIHLSYEAKRSVG